MRRNKNFETSYVTYHALLSLILKYLYNYVAVPWDTYFESIFLHRTEAATQIRHSKWLGNLRYILFPHSISDVQLFPTHR